MQASFARRNDSLGPRTRPIFDWPALEAGWAQIRRRWQGNREISRAASLHRMHQKFQLAADVIFLLTMWLAGYSDRSFLSFQYTDTRYPKELGLCACIASSTYLLRSQRVGTCLSNIFLSLVSLCSAIRHSSDGPWDVSPHFSGTIL